MTIFVEEYMGMAPGSRPERFHNVPQLPARAITQVSSGGAVSTISIDQGTQFVVMYNNAAAGFYIYGGSSTGSTTAGSTGFIPGPNVTVMRGVKGNAKLFVWST